MSLAECWQQFVDGLRATTFLEYIAVCSGIISVWFSRKENVLVYPTGLVNTIVYVYLSFKGSLFGEATVNFYYTVMSLYGWYMWTRRDARQQLVVRISFSDRRMWRNQILFFGLFYAGFFFSLSYLKRAFYSGVIPWADAFASATAFTGMWLMTRKKVESWYWWIATNVASIPLYFVKHYVVTSVYYLILLVMAIAGLITWSRRARNTHD